MRKAITFFITTSMIVYSSVVGGFAPANAATDCTITITESHKTFSGTGNSDKICILGDDNIVYALGGDDTVVDDGSNNVIDLGDGNDLYDGTNGLDASVDGGAGDDEIIGTPGTDDLSGDDGDDSLVSGAGNDTLNGGLGNDTLIGSAGKDELVGEMGDDNINGGDGDDSISGDDGADTLIGGYGNDTLNGGYGPDYLEGNVGNDSLFGESGSDTLVGNEGDDVLGGGSDLDTIDGGIGLNVCDFTDGETTTTTCRYDDSGPALVSLSLSSSTVDVSSGAEPISINLQITDESGLATGFVQCSSSGRNALLIYFSWASQSAWNVNSPVSGVVWSGNRYDSRLSANQNVASGLFPGTYQCTVSLTDVMLQTSISSSVSLTVIRNGSGFDDQGPQLESLSFTNQGVEVGSGAASTDVTLHMTDQSGFRNGWFQCYLANPGSEKTTDALLAYFTWDGKLVSNGTSTAQLVSWSGSSVDSTIVMRFEIPYGFSPNDYPCFLTLFDTKDQISQINTAQNFTVTRTGNGFDDSAPKIESFSVSPSPIDVGAGQADVDVVLRLTDQTSLANGYVDCAYSTWGSVEYRKAFLFYYHWSTKDIYSESGKDSLVCFDGTETDATLRVKAVVPAGLKPGFFTCSINATDTLNHSITDRTNLIKIFRTPVGQPPKPLSGSFIPTNPTSGTLSWMPPENLGSPNLYAYVTQMSLDGFNWIDLPGGATTDTFLSLNNLKADTDYWFRIRGENGGTVGQDTDFMSLAYEVVRFRTPPPVVPELPTELKVSAVTSTSFVLDWTAPTYNGGSKISTFTVETSKDNGLTWQAIRVGSSESVRQSVSGASPGTTYLVRIAAVNAVGPSEYLTGSATTLNIAPYAPSNLRYTDLAPTSLTLQWDLPSSNGGGRITDYKVEFSSNNGTSWSAISHTPSNNLAFDVVNLAKNKTYRFRISAINDIGTGPATPPISVTTPKSVPDSPTTLTQSLLTANSIYLTWAAPNDTGGVPLTNYKVEVSRNSGTDWLEVPHAASTARSMRVSGLVPSSGYLVRVSAINSVGQSEYLTGSFTTPRGLPLPPAALESSSVASTSLSISWGLPESNGGSDIIDYKVEVANNCGKYTSIPHAPSINLGFDVSGLNAGTKYCFRVSTQTNLGFSIASNILQVVTAGNAPSAPTSLGVKKDKTSVLLSWKRPTVVDGSPVRNYIIEYSKDLGANWITVKKRVSTSTSLSISGLKSKRTYYFRVTAVNDVGSSPSSNVLKVKTK